MYAGNARFTSDPDHDSPSSEPMYRIHSLRDMMAAEVSNSRVANDERNRLRTA